MSWILYMFIFSANVPGSSPMAFLNFPQGLATEVTKFLEDHAEAHEHKQSQYHTEGV